MLVWKAMPSITPMMSAMRRELSLMPFMVSTTLPTTLPPSIATFEAFSASSLALLALSAVWRTVEPSCSIEAAVSCSEEACCSVRVDRSALPCAISPEATSTCSAVPRTSETSVPSWAET
ncbi:hypothetical protein FQZ97_919720 [compost metagenome]